MVKPQENDDDVPAKWRFKYVGATYYCASMGELMTIAT
jgi:hypothetical protein